MQSGHVNLHGNLRERASVTVNPGFTTFQNCREYDFKIVALEEKEVSQMLHLPLHIACTCEPAHSSRDISQAWSSLCPALLRHVSGVTISLPSGMASTCALVLSLQNGMWNTVPMRSVLRGSELCLPLLFLRVNKKKEKPEKTQTQARQEERQFQ